MWLFKSKTEVLCGNPRVDGGQEVLLNFLCNLEPLSTEEPEMLSERLREFQESSSQYG